MIYARASLERVKLEVADAVLETTAQVKRAFYGAQAAQQMVGMRRAIVDAAQASAETRFEEDGAAASGKDVAIGDRVVVHTTTKPGVADPVAILVKVGAATPK